MWLADKWEDYSLIDSANGEKLEYNDPETNEKYIP